MNVLCGDTIMCGASHAGIASDACRDIGDALMHDDHFGGIAARLEANRHTFDGPNTRLQPPRGGQQPRRIDSFKLAGD